MSAPDSPRRSPSWLLMAGAVLATVGLALQEPPEPETQVIPVASAGGNADSNGTMIAVTGVDITGQSILYLVDTENRQLAIYQAAGGSSSTQGVKLVGARRIDLDLQLDGFNDKTESSGKPLRYKDLERMFESNHLLPGEPK